MQSVLKVYGIHGRTQALIKVPVNNGRAWIECEFKHGRIGAGIANRPATYPTSDSTEQNIIENSPLFGPLIFLHRVAAAETPAPAKQDTPAVGATAVTSVTSREEAIAYLKQNGAKATNLKDDESIRKYAAKIGVHFPNLYE